MPWPPASSLSHDPTLQACIFKYKLMHPDPTPQPPPLWDCHTPGHPSRPNHPGPGTKQVGAALMHQSPLNLFQPAKPKPAHPASPILAVGATIKALVHINTYTGIIMTALFVIIKHCKNLKAIKCSICSTSLYTCYSQTPF